MLQLKGRVSYCEFDPIGVVQPMDELLKSGNLNEDMLLVEYGEGPDWRVYVGWWPFPPDHPKHGYPEGYFGISAARGADKVHHVSIHWEARSLEELWSAVQGIDRWLTSSEWIDDA